MKLKPLEELFGVPENDREGDAARILELSELKDFSGHPFEVRMDEDMAELVESIRKNGILCPGIARPAKEGGYEIIAGHRRKAACILAGLASMPFYVGNYSDDEATVVMVESNLYRTRISIREKAFAYKMHMEAEKRVNNTKHQLYRYGNSKGLRSDEILAQRTGESRNTIQRYIRLTKLIRELLDMADSGKLPVITASDLSYLTEEEQKTVYEYMMEKNVVPSGKQAQKIKECSRAAPGAVTIEILDLVFQNKQARQTEKVTIKKDVLRQYFPKEYKSEDMEKVIIGLLQKWHMEHVDEAPVQMPGQMHISEWDNGKYMAEEKQGVRQGSE